MNVICIKWGSKYGPEYVNKLHSMVRRNLSLDHRFVCLTDNIKGINSEIDTLPLSKLPIQGWWYKIELFRPKLYDLNGLTLFIDLDVIVMNKIDEMFSYDGKFCIIKDWAYRGRRMFNSSVFRFNIGEYGHLWEKFERSMDRIVRSNHGDQNYITSSLSDDEVSLWPERWCLSYKYHACRPNMATPTPPDCKILTFHGRPNPHEAIVGLNRYGPAPWIENYWH